MILTRLGNKRKLAEIIMQYFPKHTIYIEPFFGAGGLFFNKPKAKYNIVNDLDDDVYNLYTVVQNDMKKLEKEFSEFPIHNSLFQHWKKNKETDPIKKAMRFLFLSNYSYLGKMDTLVYGNDNQKLLFQKLIKKTNKKLFNVQFNNADFRDFFNSIKRIKTRANNDEVFIYCDPPYLDTGNNYSDVFTEQDTKDLFKLCIGSGFNFMVSEFNSEFILELAENNGLYVTPLAIRKNLKNSKKEVIITNYKINSKLF